MQKQYRLSAGAILYAVLRLHKRSFYGVDNVLEGLTEASFPLFMQNAELELIEKGCATMNFDGAFELEPGFAALIGHCADSSAQLTVARRYLQKQQELTVCLTGQDAPVLQEADGEYLLTEGADPVAAVLEFLQLPAEEAELTEALVDSTLVEQQDEEGLKAAGCSDAVAALVVNAARGDGGYAVLSRTESDVLADEAVLLYGPQGILTATVEYTLTEELFRFSPVTIDWAAQRLRALAGL